MTADPELWAVVGPMLGAGEEMDADTQEWLAWRPAAEDLANSVYLDSTTIVTAVRLLAGERSWLTPLTLWDLATVAERVVIADRIYYTGENFVSAATLNGLLGDDVFVPVPRLSSASRTGPGRLYGHRLDAYRELIAPLVHGRGAPPGSHLGDVATQIADAWSLVTGHPVRPEEALVPCAAQAWFTPKVQLPRDAYCGELPLSTPDYCEPVLGDVTFRAYASQVFAELLGVPYAPAVVRMPFRNCFAPRSRDLDDRLRTVEAADAAYRELAGAADLTLPVFLAVALADAQQPADVWDLLADLRVRAARFREHRRALDDTLVRGQASDEARRLLAAVRSEALKLTDLFGFGYELVAHVLGRIARPAPSQLAGDASTVAGIARANLPADVRRRIAWWFFRPDLRFLTEVRTQSRQMTDAMPQVGRLWRLPPSQDTRFRRRFEQLATLRSIG